jgi:peptidoglycan/LPS O-acetylase OafA/YrhL
VKIAADILRRSVIEPRTKRQPTVRLRVWPTSIDTRINTGAQVLLYASSSNATVAHNRDPLDYDRSAAAAQHPSVVNNSTAAIKAVIAASVWYDKPKHSHFAHLGIVLAPLWPQGHYPPAVFPTDPPMRLAKNDRLPGLDGLRGIAAILVVLGHHNADAGWTFWPVLHFVQYYLSASLAVALFFSLSSFLLTYLLVKEYDQNGSISFRGFFVRRILRIWPLYFVVLSTALLIVPADSWSWTIANLWRWLTFTSNWSLALNGIHGIDHSSSPLAVMWSIAVEEQFYLICPFVVNLMLRATFLARIFGVAAAAMAAVAYRCWSFVYLSGLQHSLPKGVIYYATPSYIDVFVIGGIGGWLVARKLHTIPRIPGAIVAALLVCAILAWRQTLLNDETPFYIICQPLAAIAFVAIILWLITNPRQHLVRTLNSRPLVVLGLLSYGIYLWHPISGAAYWYILSQWRDVLSLGAFNTIAVISFVGAGIGSAAIGYFLIERPMLNIARRDIIRHPPSVVT